MLRRVDSVFAWVTWAAAVAVVVMLLIGPQVVAEDKSESSGKAAGSAPYASGGQPDGKAVFSGNCGSCHTLKAAGTSGQVGPNLDDISLGASEIEAVIRSGRGVMPSFSGRLSDAEISAVAAFVAKSR